MSLIPLFPLLSAMKWWDRCHDFSFLYVEHQASFSLSSFTFIKRLFFCSSLSAIRVVSSAYLRLLIFFPAILMPACDSSSLAISCDVFCTWGFPGGSVVKNMPATVEDTGSIPGSGRSPGEGNGNPLQYYCWRIPQTEEPGRLLSTGLQRVGHNLVTE